MLRRGTYRQHPPAHRHGRARRALPVQPHHGCPWRHPRHDAPPGRPGRVAAAGLALAGDRHRPQPVAAGGVGDRDGRQRACGPGGQLLRGATKDGDEQRGPGRESVPPGARPGPRSRDHRRRERTTGTVPLSPQGRRSGRGANKAVTEVKAELVGSVWKITAKPGDQVAEEDTLLILESMKMEIPVTAPRAGTVKEIRVKETDVVKEGQVLVVLE